MTSLIRRPGAGTSLPPPDPDPVDPNPDPTPGSSGDFDQPLPPAVVWEFDDQGAGA